MQKIINSKIPSLVKAKTKPQIKLNGTEEKSRMINSLIGITTKFHDIQMANERRHAEVKPYLERLMKEDDQEMKVIKDILPMARNKIKIEPTTI